MKLIYNGGNRKLSRVVKRANEILLSNFYFIEIEKCLQQNYDVEKSSMYLKQLQSINQEVRIKGFWNPIGNKEPKIKGNYIKINTAHLSKSHRILLAQLIEDYFLVADQNKNLSEIISLKSDKNLSNKFGLIAKNFM